MPQDNSSTQLFDLVISGALIVDGTGTPPVKGDIGVSDGRIAAISAAGELTHADRVIDAAGLVVSPGFVDPHTHYDAQLLWDPSAAPSSIHGVTSILGGNCGFTLAPLNDGDGTYTAEMMARVEGMPLAALEEGVDWKWNSTAEYLDRLDGNIGVNAGFLVGHCAIRRQVMGTDSVKTEATEEQIAEMKQLLSDSLAAGGMGFSTTRARTHADGDGEPVASRWASEDELISLAETVSEHPGTTLEFASDGCLDGFDSEEVEFMIRFSKAAQRPLNWNVLTIDSHAPERYENQLKAMDHCRESGARVVALTMPVIVPMNMSFLNFCALNLMPDWGDILSLPLAERMAKLKDPGVRKFMQDRAASPDAGVFARLTGWDIYVIGDTFSDANEGLSGRKVGDIAAERGDDNPFNTLIDIVLEDDLRTVLWPGATDNDDESWALRQQAWGHPSVMLGGSDAGAHLDRMQGSGYTTRFLGDCLRGRKLVSLERAVQMITQVPAELFGLTDRGVIAEGAHADLVLFDPETIDSEMLTMVADLPAGEKRLHADSIGINHVFIGGVETVTDGKFGGQTPGKILRSGLDTETVLVT